MFAYGAHFGLLKLALLTAMTWSGEILCIVPLEIVAPPEKQVLDYLTNMKIKRVHVGERQINEYDDGGLRRRAHPRNPQSA